MMPVRKRRDCNSWEVIVYVGKGASGGKEYIRESYKDKEQAKARELALRKELAENRGRPATRETVAEYLKRWLAHYEVAVPSPRTYAQAEQFVRLHIIPEIGHIRLRKLTALDIQEALDRKRRAGLSAKSVKHMHAVLRNALNQAVEWELLARNPMRKVKVPRVRKTDPPVWTAAQLAVYLEEARKTRFYAAFYLAANAGMRRAEIANLRWADIDFDRGMIYVRGQTKTDQSRRPIHLSDDALQILREHQAMQEAEKQVLGSAYRDQGYVFTIETGERVGLDWLTHLHQKIAARAGLPHIRLHGLRHTMATLMLQAGIHPKVVAERMGIDTKTLLEIYSHVMPTIHREAAVTLGNILINARNGVSSTPAH